MRHGKRLRSGLGALVLVVVVTGCGKGAPGQTRVARAEQLLDAGNYSAAMLEIKNELQEKPADPAAELALARASLMLSNTDSAARALDDARAHGGDPAKLSQLRLQLLQQTGAHEEVIKQLDSGALTLPAPQRELARAQSLAGLRRCPAAIKVARTLLGDAATLVPARVVLAECYAQAGQRGYALELLEAAVKQQPDSADAWLALGRLQQLLGKNSDAEQSWMQAGAKAAGHLTVLQQLMMETALGDLQLARDDLAAARATHGRMLRLAPQGGLSALFDARLLMVGGEHDAAVTALRALVNRAPDFPAARVVLGSALLASGNREQALAEVSKLAHDQPDTASLASAAKLLRDSADAKLDSEEYWMAVAGTQAFLGQAAMSRQALEKAANIAADSPRISSARVQLELRTGNNVAAQRLAEALVAKRPDDPVALSLLAQSQRVQNKLPEAFATLARLQKQQPSAETAAMMYAVQKEYAPEDARAPLEAWLAQHPGATRLRAMLADALMQAGKNQAAIAEYQKILAATPNDVPILNNVAWLYHLEKDPRALDVARKAWQLAPKMASVADTYGWVLIESGAHAEALTVLAPLDEGGVLIEPESRYHYAVALARNGKNVEARERLGMLLNEAGAFPSRAAAESLAGNLK